MRPFIRLTTLLVITAALGIAAHSRVERSAEWQPRVPLEFGWWKADGAPQKAHLKYELARAPSVAVAYRNPMGGSVTAEAIVVRSPASLHDPRYCVVGSGYMMEGDSLLTLEPGARVRAMMFTRGQERLAMLFWLQDERGAAFAGGKAESSYRARLWSIPWAFSSVASGRRTCIVRVYTEVAPADAHALEAREDLLDVARQIRRSLIASLKRN